MKNEPQVHTAAGLTKAAVISEMHREYVFNDGFTYRITNPVTLYVKRKPDGDSHRVVDADGTIHYIPVGWRVLRWVNKPGFPEVEF